MKPRNSLRKYTEHIADYTRMFEHYETEMFPYFKRRMKQLIYPDMVAIIFKEGRLFCQGLALPRVHQMLKVSKEKVARKRKAIQQKNTDDANLQLKEHGYSVRVISTPMYD